MPRLPIDFKKSVIYKIVNADESLIYVGSTTDFRKRKAQHKKCCNNEKYKQSSLHVYQMIRDNGGWDSFTMIPIKEFPCENKIQLVIEEERNRKELKANLNKYKAHRTEDEQVEENKKKCKVYRETHKAENEAYTKAYREIHKAEIKEQKKAHYQEHKEQIKAYKEAHKEQIKAYQKAYREKQKKLA